jgi:hypothetical protein
LVLLPIFWAIPITSWYVGGPKWLVYLTAILPILLSWPLTSSWRKRGRSDNWILALYGDGLWLNLRDCEYCDAEPGETIVFLPYREIAAVRRVVHRYSTPSSDNDTTAHKDVYLELQLATDDTAALKKALTDERRRNPPPHSYFGGFVTSQTRRTQFPIEMEGDKAVRIKFAVFGSGYGLRPSLKKLLATLDPFVTVESEETINTENWRKLDDSQFDALVERLVRSGQRIDAVRLIQERKKISTTAAHNLVEELGRRERQPASDSRETALPA